MPYRLRASPRLYQTGKGRSLPSVKRHPKLTLRRHRKLTPEENPRMLLKRNGATWLQCRNGPSTGIASLPVAAVGRSGQPPLNGLFAGGGEILR